MAKMTILFRLSRREHHFFPQGERAEQAQVHSPGAQPGPDEGPCKA